MNESTDSTAKKQQNGLYGVQPAVLLRLIVRERWTVARIAIPVFLLVTLVAFLLPPQYTATATLIPPNNPGAGSAAALMGQLSALGAGSLLGGSVKSPGDLYIGILRSRSIADELIHRFKLMDVYGVSKESVAAKQLAVHTDIAVGLKDGIIAINVTDKNPTRARDIVAGYLDALRAKTADLALSESSQRRLFYEHRLAKEKDDLSNAEVELKKTQERTGLVAPAGQAATEIQAIAQLRAEIAGRQVRLASLRHDQTDESPDIIRLRSEIADLQGQVARMESGAGKTLSGGMTAAQVPSFALEYIRAAREVKYHEALFDILAKQYEAGRLDEARDPTLQILDGPTVPDMKSGPPRKVLMAAGFAAGLLFAVAWILFQAWRRVSPPLFKEEIP